MYVCMCVCLTAPQNLSSPHHCFAHIVESHSGSTFPQSTVANTAETANLLAILAVLMHPRLHAINTYGGEELGSSIRSSTICEFTDKVVE